MQLNYKELEIIGPLSTDFRYIRKLDLSHNFIYSLDGIEVLEHLEILNVSFNKLESIKELEKISKPNQLLEMEISCNPLTNDPEHKKKILVKFINL